MSAETALTAFRALAQARLDRDPPDIPVAPWWARPVDPVVFGTVARCAGVGCTDLLDIRDGVPFLYAAGGRSHVAHPGTCADNVRRLNKPSYREVRWT